MKDRKGRLIISKKHYYHKARSLRLDENIITKPKYKIVTKKGKTIETFRLKATARNELSELQDKRKQQLDIVVI